MIFGLKISIKVSTFKEAESIIKIADISNMDTYSLKCRISTTELIPIFAEVIPIAVTDKRPVPLTITSTTVKQKITTVKTTGDFKNSGTYPFSNIQPMSRPKLQPRTSAIKATVKNIAIVVP